jgi:glutamate synthase domain-containing protein 2/glutamate synthase domain-containing protein 1/glutamate synthase domain-containing protein 3
MEEIVRHEKEGLYDPSFEHDACGVGFVANLNGKKSHDIVRKGVQILENLEHRGAVGAEKNSGDGAGITVQMPDEFFRKECSKLGVSLPKEGNYGVGTVFLPKDDAAREKIMIIFKECAEELGQEILGWRNVPTNHSILGMSAFKAEPHISQVFLKQGKNTPDQAAFERKLYVIRNYAKKRVKESGADDAGIYYIVSLSSSTVSYKGMLTALQLSAYFPDLSDESLKSALALVHSRFSTNVMPSWPLAHPFRYIAHNGEINTLRGNINWMRAREALFVPDLFTKEDLDMLRPIIDDGQSDSAILDNVVELLVLNGRSLPHVMMMLIPEAWASDKEMSSSKKAFYEFHATLTEPWDGPASIAFTDGKIIGATLDRNGLRPSRYFLTHDGTLVMSSEAGVLDFPPESIKLKGRLQPGRMFVASLEEGRIIPDEEIKEKIAAAKPYAQWLKDGKLELSDIPASKSTTNHDFSTLARRQATFGYTFEDLKLILAPIADNGEEPIGSMGSDTPLAVLSDRPQLLFNYFYQLFAQVTNPPIDSIREESVMSLVSFIGAQGQILSEAKEHCLVIELPNPVLTNEELGKLRSLNQPGFGSVAISTLFPAVDEGGNGMKNALDKICALAGDAVSSGKNIIILSDRGVDEKNAPIPSLLAVSAVHHHLIREGKRAKCGIVVETGEAREVHHFALLLGFGASGINPYLAFESIADLVGRKMLDPKTTEEKGRNNFIKAIDKGLLKTIAKMGISTIQSYIGAQIFEAVGLGDELVDRYFTKTPSRIGGIGLETLEKETLIRHQSAYPKISQDGVELDSGGDYYWRARGEKHTFNPETVQLLQSAVRKNDYSVFKQFSKQVNSDSGLNTLRGLLEFTNTSPVPLEEVEPVEKIVKRFFNGAMSLGSISKEAHETIAIAMNRIGAKSNTGEGGEDAERYKVRPNGDFPRSAIKQVASGRFGVTSNYLVNADEIQIKMAQGAKPGEGGQLPGLKVDKNIARLRHSTPGVGLISPPPHHDIYSIEDLAQLIFDLKNANNKARINVKLVSEAGVGTIAAGVAKGHAEAVLISGHDGGTGASPLSSIKHAGLPWELGLAETHQVLMRNNLRSRIVVQTDGRLITGRDAMIAALLGAEEWGAATSGLVSAGCIMMRKCHLNNCPVGVATQDPDLRKNFSGKPEHVVNFYMFLAAELREHMALLGFRTVNEMIGRVDKLKVKDNITHYKAKHVRVEKLLHSAKSSGCASYCCEPQDFGLDDVLDYKLIEIAKPALESGKKVSGSFAVRNINRAIGSMLSAEISRKYGEAGLPEDTITIKVSGTAGQSFSAFGAKGLFFELEGEANDYFCKGLSGAKVVLYPNRKSTFKANDNVIVGNVALYGATAGEVYIQGMGGERFCVRNSGANVVVEAIGDHGCEYMTGGRVVILGPVGKNFAAGMSGGIAYILDLDGKSKTRVNSGIVDMEALEEPSEIAFVKGFVERHHKYTDSPHAKWALDNWDTIVRKFVKVIPQDYKKALAEAASEKGAPLATAV